VRVLCKLQRDWNRADTVPQFREMLLHRGHGPDRSGPQGEVMTTAEWTKVLTPAELVAATQGPGAAIQVDGVVHGMPMITLAPGVQLRDGRCGLAPRACG
jgi:hypothetical protein